MNRDRIILVFLLGATAALASLEGVVRRERPPLPVAVEAKPQAKYRTTDKTKFYIDGREVTAKEFRDGAGEITELEAVGEEITTIKAKGK